MLCIRQTAIYSEKKKANCMQLICKHSGMGWVHLLVFMQFLNAGMCFAKARVKFMLDLDQN